MQSSSPLIQRTVCRKWSRLRSASTRHVPNPSLPLQVDTLNLVGVKHLFVVERIRTSQYVKMLAEAFPELRASLPGMISEPALPELRNLVLVDFDVNPAHFEAKCRELDLKSAINWREIMVWEDGRTFPNESFHRDDVVNLQFTR